MQPDDDQRLDALIERVKLSTMEASDALDDALAFVAESNKRLVAMALSQRMNAGVASIEKLVRERSARSV